MPDTIDFQDRLYTSNAWKRMRVLNSLTLSLEIFMINYLQLRNVLTSWKTGKLQHLLFIKNRSDLEKFQIEVIRLIHNYVSGAGSLIDHTRKIYRDLYESQGQLPKYQERINREFKSDPLSSFVKELRQYCYHYGPPAISVKKTWQEADGESYDILLPKTVLMKYDRWTKPSRTFIQSHEDSISILDIISRYEKKLECFYNWFYREASVIHRSELQKLISEHTDSNRT